MTSTPRFDDLPVDRKCEVCGITYETRWANLKFRPICWTCAKAEAETLQLQAHLEGDLVCPDMAVA